MASSPAARRNDDHRRRRRRNTAALATKVAATAVVAYGAYRAVHWYLDDDDHDTNENENDRGRRERQSGDELQEEGQHDRRPRLSSSNNESSSWWFSATHWALDTATSTVVNSVAAAISAAATAASAAAPSSSTSHNSHQEHPHQQQERCAGHPRPSSAKIRRQRLLQCRQKTLTAFDNCLPSLQPVIEQLTNTSRYTKELKELRKQNSSNGNESGKDFPRRQKEKEERVLWQRILVETTTRMMVSSYAYTLLLLSLTVQLHWIGHRILMEEENEIGDIDSSHDNNHKYLSQVQEEAQTMLMDSHEYMVEEGLPLLVSTIRRAVQAVLLSEKDDDDENTGKNGASWTSPTRFLTQAQIEEALYHVIPEQLNRGGRSTSSSSSSSPPSSLYSRNWIRFVLPDPDDDRMDQVWDICSSPVWEDAQAQVLERLWFKVLKDQGWGRLFEGEAQEELQHTRQPLAKVIAQFKKASSLVFDDIPGTQNSGTRNGSSQNGSGGKTLASRLQSLPTVLELGDVSFEQG